MEEGFPYQDNTKKNLKDALKAQIKNIMDNHSAARQAFYDTYKVGDRKEFINGEVVPQLPKLKHNIPLKNLLNIVKAFIKRHEEGLVLEDALVALEFNDLMPDISYFGSEKKLDITKQTILFPAPDFVVEVLSNTSEIIDKELKMNEYEQNGVSEYWIVSPEDEDIFQYYLNSETRKYQFVERMNENIVCKTLSNLSIPLDAIFDGSINLSFVHEILADLEE